MGIAIACVTLIVPFLYILCGILFAARTPAYRSGGIAYRSKRASMNEMTWMYANHYFGVVSIFVGVYIVFATALLDAVLWKIGIPSSGAWVFSVVIVVIQVLLVFLVFHNTEEQLKVSFDEQGKMLRTEKTIRFQKRIKEKDWGTWKEWPEEEEDGWVDWETWLHNRDMELDQEREERESKESLPRLPDREKEETKQ